jgi:glycosyltransferase involved in cell wall biosynthesis
VFFAHRRGGILFTILDKIQMTSARPLTIETAQQLIDDYTHEVCDDQLVQDPLISVCLVTYNHCSYIQQALDGVLAQKTSCPVEIVIGDDCSDDGTTEIVREFQRMHPERIRLLTATQNLGRHTGNGRLNFIRTLRACRGRYIAMLDGDDYWISDNKLQDQFIALETHSNWAICFHRARVVNETNGETVFELPGDEANQVYTLTDVLSGNFMATATVMFRNRLIKKLPQWFYEIRFADWPMHVQNARHGDVGFLPQTMTIHRIHKGSIFSSMDDGARWRMTYEVFELMSQNIECEHESEFREARRRLMDRMFRDMTNLRCLADRLRAANQQLSQPLERQIQELHETYESSLSMRVGRVMTWPLRVLAKPFLGK